MDSSAKTAITATKQTTKGRRTKGKGDSNAGAPIFLRKTYDMINTCPDDIASWYDDGTTFVVKDTERFAAEVVPEYFKHNNFSSFVRQLNFYGFRKIKSDPLRIKDAANSEVTKYWKFKHDKFQQGRPDLLSQIRKNQNEAADKQEVEALKGEVRGLKETLAATNKTVDELKGMLAAVLKAQELSMTATFPVPPPVPCKKRKTSHDPDPMPVLSEMPPVVSSMELEPAPFQDRSESDGAASFDSLEEDVLASLMGPDTATSDVFAPLADDNVNPVLLDRLRNSLARLPPNMQQMFVDRIVSVMADPETFRKQVEAITTLADSAGQTAKKRLPDDGSYALVAAAVLGAYLTQVNKEA